MTRVVILGGTGNFGARIVRALSADAGIELVAAGRRSGTIAGAHYLDLADARSFVCGFHTAVQASAERAGRAAISGASTLPALSSAVIESLRESLSTLDEVEIAIAPGQRAPRGAATLEAVFSYLGRPVNVWEDGRWRPAGAQGRVPDQLGMDQVGPPSLHRRRELLVAGRVAAAADAKSRCGGTARAQASA